MTHRELTNILQDMLQLTTEESAELLLLLNGVDLAHYPQLRRIQGRLQALKPESSQVITDPPPHPTSSRLSTPPVPRPQPPPPAESESESPHELELSHCQPQYKPTVTDDEFCSALNKLRRDRTQVLYGLAILNNLGPDLIMGDSILDHIAECARAHKLTSLDDLYRETRWDQTWELGGQVLELVSRYVVDEHILGANPLIVTFPCLRYYPRPVERARLTDGDEGTATS
ncbi:hypothetical protein GSI_01448 [Ganoderma sinense ZZ0214-1]|uniref:Uncharacterized protein n=1 Tax=Ganoderma sinense ZZ0214-1 TaxID=1077348 RepID=A0A2G8SVG5_9APHY|nr:hypothetical protein GSI_01448 [Ganoderma sinense ZZ0214-1]